MRHDRKGHFGWAAAVMLLLLWGLTVPDPAHAAEDEPAGESGSRVALGEEARGFTLPDETGRRHSLEEITGDKSLVLIFFRGVW